MLSSITSLIQALEARDVYTRGHSEAVAEIAVGMGRVMGFEDDELESLEIAARLHDLGKIGIPDSVLLKPGKLTVKEYEVIKTHPTIGAGILEPIPSMAPLIPAVMSHHERMDGKGYPQGLKGKDIPLWARIIAVGDIYHALTSNRPYRDPHARRTCPLHHQRRQRRPPLPRLRGRVHEISQRIAINTPRRRTAFIPSPRHHLPFC